MKVTILCISDSDKHFETAIKEYCKRLGKTVKVVNIKPVKHGSREQIISKETDKILSKIAALSSKLGKTILLSKEGTSLKTEQYLPLLQKHNETTIIIGGPYGLDEKALESYCQQKISLGSHTMPHGLAKLVILEQIYRAQCIHSGKKYHY